MTLKIQPGNEILDFMHSFGFTTSMQAGYKYCVKIEIKTTHHTQRNRLDGACVASILTV